MITRIGNFWNRFECQFIVRPSLSFLEMVIPFMKNLSLNRKEKGFPIIAGRGDSDRFNSLFY